MQVVVEPWLHFQHLQNACHVAMSAEATCKAYRIPPIPTTTKSSCCVEDLTEACAPAGLTLTGSKYQPLNPVIKIIPLSASWDLLHCLRVGLNGGRDAAGLPSNIQGASCTSSAVPVILQKSKAD